ncbi:MAG: flagellar motor protein MotB [Rickettsiaceae bacterium]
MPQKFDANQPIVFKKVHRKNQDHHIGQGTWKIAYADFITAMMAFFLLLWLLAVSSQETLKGVAEYFASSTIMNDQNAISSDGDVVEDTHYGITAEHVTSDALIYGVSSRGRKNTKDDFSGMSTSEQQHFMSIISNIQHNTKLQDFAENIVVDMTNEGLRIQIMDSYNRSIFKPDTYELEPYVYKILMMLGKMIQDQPNYLSFTGYTASVKSNDRKKDKKIDDWSLSALRANAIREFFVSKFIQDDKVAKIVGKADTEPFDLQDKNAPNNIRVSITLLKDSAVNHFQKSIPAKTNAQK